MIDIREVVSAGLSNPETGWSMGSFGAIAEFHHVAGDPPASVVSGLAQVTSRGGVYLSSLDGVRPVAYETLSPKPHRWSQAVALCLPLQAASMNKRDCLTELGLDSGALRSEDKDATLFDMGLNQLQVDFCIRTANPDLLSILRASEGRSLFEPDNPVMGAILMAHPHRVALTKLGRVEVFQKIGGQETGGVSPEGPHTHVLPKLLRTGKLHSANAPIPEGWVPCATFHPGNPVFGRLGEDKEFDQQAFSAFQTLLDAWGVEDYVKAKRLVWSALKAGALPNDHHEPDTRLGRVGLRNAIRQWRRQKGDQPLLQEWAERFDRQPASS